jgi:hypothetical protein
MGKEFPPIKRMETIKKPNYYVINIKHKAKTIN